MSFISAILPSDPYGEEQWGLEGKGSLGKQLTRISRFLRGLRVEMRFGKLTRAPLRLIRFQLQGSEVECDWFARLPDAWDADLNRNTRNRHQSLQALRDAIDVRAMLFELMPQVESAKIRVYRENADYSRELIITGSTQRNDHSARNIHSLAMRAKILGFRFQIEGDVLRAISAREPRYTNI